MGSEVYNNTGYYNPYYHKQNEAEEYHENANNSWNQWNSPPPRYGPNYNRNAHRGNPANYGPYHPNAPNQYNHPPPGNNRMRYGPYQRNTRGYYRQSRYPNMNYPYANNPTNNWQRTVKTTKKKKKPLSQNIPNKKDWTPEDAQMAINTEKAYNKKSKNALIIKFPDHELNKEIVSQFHEAIESVHFQQPCTPRFCFITIEESTDPEEVISALNKRQFGEGFLTVEYKKDRDEELVVLADDIDPLTLYVGNLAQEVTKDDIIQLYPENKRIDIGFAKKMKFTRYAFIGFKTPSEALEAFKNTHCTQMYNKSLIVRFRRLHGTIGMPGEAKPQNPPRSREDNHEGSIVSTSTTFYSQPESEAAESINGLNATEDDSSIEPTCANLENLKRERHSPLTSDDESEYKPLFRESKGLFSNTAEEFQWNHRPKVKTEPNVSIKKEYGSSQVDRFNVSKIKTESNNEAPNIKHEPTDIDSDEGLDTTNLYQDTSGDNNDEDDEDTDDNMMDFDRIYENIMSHKNKLRMLRGNGRV